MLEGHVHRIDISHTVEPKVPALGCGHLENNVVVAPSPKVGTEGRKADPSAEEVFKNIKDYEPGGKHFQSVYGQDSNKGC